MVHFVAIITNSDIMHCTKLKISLCCIMCSLVREPHEHVTYPKTWNVFPMI